jgi:hypothetical protein
MNAAHRNGLSHTGTPRLPVPSHNGANGKPHLDADARSPDNCAANAARVPIRLPLYAHFKPPAMMVEAP